jgi:hypothetical protein
MAAESVSGEKWYSFQALRSGTVSVEVMPGVGDVHVNVFNSSYAMMNNSAAPVAGMAVASMPVTAGATYMLRVSGTSASMDLHLANAVSELDRVDTSRDGKVTPRDVLLVINEILTAGPHATPMEAGNPTLYLDTSMNGTISTQDVLMVINYLLTHSATASPAAAPSVAPASSGGESTGTSSLRSLDTSGSAAVASGLAMSGQTESSAAIAAPAVDAVFTELESQVATASSAASSNATWSAFSPADNWLEEEADEDLLVTIDE